MTNSIFIDLTQNTRGCLKATGKALDKAGSWLGKEITNLSKNLHKAGTKVKPTAEKITTTFLDILKSPYFQGAVLVAVGLGLVAFSARQILQINEEKDFEWNKEYAYPLVGLVAGLAIVAAGAALALVKR